MPTLERLLVDYDDDMIDIIADLWDVDLPAEEAAIPTLVEVMSSQAAVDATWQRLTTDEQAALLKLQANEGRLPFARFAREYGEIRPMGPARRSRERPWLEPQSVTEALYYRGLIARIFLREPTGSQEYITIPGRLADLLPTPERQEVIPGYTALPPRIVPQGASTAHHDITTLIALLYIRTLDARPWRLPAAAPRIDRHLRRPDPTYRTLITQLAFDMQLINTSEEGLTRVDRDAVRPWLEAPADHQRRMLLEAWLRSQQWNMLAHTPGLTTDDDWPNDPRLARLTLLDAMRHIPEGVWWSIDGLIQFIYETQPDFQRPHGDFTTWYLYDAYTGEPLQGYDHWFAVEGQHLRAIIQGPLHWLGAVIAHHGALTLTPLGLALLDRADWPSRPDPDASVEVNAQGEIHVPPAISRYARLQVARFGAWVAAPPPPDIIPGTPPTDDGTYTYRITTQALERVTQQGITIEQITAYLQRLAADSLPPTVSGMLSNWLRRPDDVTIHDSVIVVLKDPVVVERLRRLPQVDHILGREVGPRAFAVRRAQLDTLIEVLRAAETLPHQKDYDPDDYP